MDRKPQFVHKGVLKELHVRIVDIRSDNSVTWTSKSNSVESENGCLHD